MPRSKKIILSAAVAACFVSNPYWLGTLQAAELNTNIPKSDEEIVLGQKITVNLPAQPLAASLKALSTKIGLNITYNDKLVSDKQAPAISGSMRSKEALQKLLANTGLEAKLNDQTLYIQRIPTRVEDKSVELDKVEVRAKKFYEVGPMPGLALTKEEIPGNVQSLTAKDIKEAHTLTITDLLNQKLQSITVNDFQSNPFQMDLQYRGFTASPQLGTAQGISVFLDGIRVNEPFGDVVNWDMIPMNALSGLEIIPGSNPVFGLGTLGGALTMRTKSGFDGKTFDAEVLTGSFGRKQLQFSAGNNNGDFAGFLSGNFFLEDGWRDNSPSKVNQLFGKTEWQSDRARLSLSMLYAGSKLTGNGLLPQQMVDQNPKQVYTSPDESKNDLLQFQLSGVWDVTDNFNITAQVYNRKSKRISHTSDVNENFGGLDQRPNIATPNARDSRQLLPGLPDINRDGLPDYNNYAYNIAAGPDGRALDMNGIAFGDNGFDINNLAYGNNFRDPIVAGQGSMTALDGSNDTVPMWTYDPRRDSEDPFNSPSNIDGVFNEPTTSEYSKIVNFNFKNRGAVLVTVGTYARNAGFNPDSGVNHPGTGGYSYIYDVQSSALQGSTLGSYTDSQGFFHDYLELLPVINQANLIYPTGCGLTGVYNQVVIVPCFTDKNGLPIYRDGKYGGGAGYANTGYIDGTPTAIFNDTQINQLGKGGAIQFNWNYDKHKFMIGSSLDKSDSSYESKQYLGFLDTKRHGYTAPDQLGWEYYANSPSNGFALNDFKGDSITKSVYLSETWTPIKNLNINASARFNHTEVNNKLDVANINAFGDVNRIFNALNALTLCTDNNNDGTIDPNTECPTGLGDYIVPFEPSFGAINARGQNLAGMESGEHENFKYRSFNPSLGVTWQARENLNLYANWGKGARTPTTIELGCAFDDSPVFDKNDPVTGQPIYVKRTWRERRSCNLPGAMSGDPYLKQVRSNSLEFGARGQLNPDLEWNATVYRTDLQDDIYFVSVNAIQNYFQNIGNTRRQGLEMGLKGRWGNASWGVNYGLTDATFQSAFTIASPSNSSAGNVYDLNSNREGKLGQIDVKSGDRIPGIALHNLNLNFAYDVTSKWKVGLNMVVHSEAFVRGNENNKHKAGPASPLVGPYCTDPVTGVTGITCSVERADFAEGRTPGYGVLNLNTSYKLSPEWTLGLRINNLLDKEYASAGRLGLNAFSPSIRGVIGESGFNYNSADWQGTSFLGTGAPRSAFVTLSYEFQPKKTDFIE